VNNGPALQGPPPFLLRGGLAFDQSYVGSTWTRSMLIPHVSERRDGMRTWPEISACIDLVLERPETRVLVAHPPHNRKVILGWLVYAAGGPARVVHYLYVRQTAGYPGGWRHVRGHQLGAAMLAHIGVGELTPVVCTSVGPASRDMRARYPAASFLPLPEYLQPGART
jgi:hypothetical protein